MTIKLKQELLPEAFLLLSHFMHEYLQRCSGGVSADTANARSAGPTLSRAQLLLIPAVPETHVTTAGSPSKPALSSASKHALASKVKVALLALLRECCTGAEGVQRLMQTQAAALTFLGLPLLASSEVRSDPLVYFSCTISSMTHTF
jgi:hypothetical protein